MKSIDEWKCCDVWNAWYVENGKGYVCPRLKDIVVFELDENGNVIVKNEYLYRLFSKKRNFLKGCFAMNYERSGDLLWSG